MTLAGWPHNQCSTKKDSIYVLPREMQYRGFLSLKEVCVTNECEMCTRGSKLQLYMLKDVST